VRRPNCDPEVATKNFERSASAAEAKRSAGKSVYKHFDITQKSCQPETLAKHITSLMQLSHEDQYIYLRGQQNVELLSQVVEALLFKATPT